MLLSTRLSVALNTYLHVTATKDLKPHIGGIVIEASYITVHS